MSLEPTEALLAGRYQLGPLLGRGSTADVYVTLDVRLGATVALKRFRERSPEAIRDLKAEFRTLAGIDHAGLIKLFDLVVSDETAFFTMELFEGQTIVEHIRSAPEREVARAVSEVADAIRALHARGVLHRDIKPSNVLVSPIGHVRVLDFGLAGLKGPLAGTLAYMAPELFEGASPGPAADWYGLGVILHEALTGAVPVVGTSLPEIVLRKRMRRFRRVREASPSVRPDLDELVWALLEPDPRKRASHESVVAILHPAAATFEVRAATAGGTIFGRAPELAQMGAALERATEGKPTLLLVEGPSGIGKTALVRTFLESSAGCSALRGAARPQELVPLRAIDAAVEQLTVHLEALPEPARGTVLHHVSSSLVQSFPVLASLDASLAGREPSLEALESRRQAQASLAAVLRALAARAPLVIWIDDIQWADHESLLFLRTALEAGPGKLLLVLTRRPGALASTEHEEWLQAGDRIHLGPLDENAADSLLRARAFRNRALDSATITRALHEAGGNAFLLEFFARHASDQVATFDMDSALRRALATLAPDARMLFECVVLTQHPLTLACLGGVLPDRSRLRDLAAALTSSGLVSVDEQERVRPYHDALRERADALLGAAERPDRHGRIVGAMQARDVPIAWWIPHLEGAGRTHEAGEACLEAGNRSSQTHAFEIAVQYFQKALALGQLSSAVRADTLEKLSDNLSLMGRGREAAARYEEAAGLLPEAQTARAVLRLEHKRALALLRTGALDEGREVLKSVLHGVGERLPEGTIAAARMFILERIRRRIDRWRRAPAEPLDDASRLRLDVLWTAGTSLAMYAPVPANALQTRFVRQAMRADDSRRVTRALAMELLLLAAVGGHWRADANTIARELEASFDAIPWPYEQAWVAATLGAGAWLAGDLRACLDWTTRARRLFRDVPEMSAFEFAVLDAWRVPAMALVGDFDEAVRTADELLTIAIARDDHFASLACLHGYITLAYVATGKVDLAQKRVELGRVRATQLASSLPAFLQLWSATTLALHAGDGAGAHEVVRHDWARLRRSGALLFESCLVDSRDLRARTAIAAARSVPARRREDILADARAQSRWLHTSTLRHAPALSYSLDAQVALLGGRDHDAEAHTQTAISSFDALGLRPNADALRRWRAGAAPEQGDLVFIPR